MTLRLLIAPCRLVHMHHRRLVLIVGVRELRQNASEVLRAVDAGEPATVTDAGWDAERRDFGAVGLRDPWAG